MKKSFALEKLLKYKIFALHFTDGHTETQLLSRSAILWLDDLLSWL